jgi:transposase
MRQCAAKQACAMVRGTLEKQKKQLYVLNKLQKEGKDTKYLQRKMSLFPPSKPNVKNVNPELDARFVDFQETPGGHFDLFIRLSQLGDKEEVIIPIKHHKVSRKWLEQGELKGSVRLMKNFLVLFCDVPDVPKRTTGKKVGGDQGEITCLSLGPNGDDQFTKKDKDGHDLKSICEDMARKQKGSKGFEKAQAHRTNYINWSINQLNFTGVMIFALERLLGLRRGKVTSRELSHFEYTAIKKKLISRSENEGFNFTEQDNKFRSQRCSKCGWVHVSNRKGKTFKCKNAICGFVADADLNAASNHEIELWDIAYSVVWYKHMNRTTGFFWQKDGAYTSSGERIVPHAQKE